VSRSGIAQFAHGLHFLTRELRSIDVQASCSRARAQRLRIAVAGAQFQQLAIARRQRNQAALEAFDRGFEPTFTTGDPRAGAPARRSFDRRQFAVAGAGRAVCAKR
jgi:hypothetical protein